MQQYIESLEKIIQRRFSLMDRDSNEVLLVADFGAKLAVVTGSTAAAATEVWDSIRDDGDATNFFLDILAEFRFRNNLDDKSWREFCGMLSQCVSFPDAKVTEEYRSMLGVKIPDELNVTDKVLLDRINGTKQIEALYYMNPWYVILVLLTFCDLKLILTFPKRLGG